MADPLLAFQAVTLGSEEGRTLLSDFTWSLERGSLVGLPWSPETSALLRLAAGALQPREGRVSLAGATLGAYAFDHPFLRRGALGWVPREGGLLVNQTLLMNLALPLVFVRRMPRAAAETAALAALQAAGLAEAAEHRPHALYPRERWLGALAKAALMEPELWLIEPPPASLGGRMREAAAALMERAVGSTAIFAGDDDGIPWSSCQRLRWDEGRLIPGEA